MFSIQFTPEKQVILLPKCTACFSDCSDRRLNLNGNFSGKDFQYRRRQQRYEIWLLLPLKQSVEDLKILKEDESSWKTMGTRSVKKSGLCSYHSTALLLSKGNIYYYWVVCGTLPALLTLLFFRSFFPSCTSNI